MEKRRVFIADIVRTPLGRPGGSLERFMASDLSAPVILKLLERTKTEPLEVGQTVIGQSLPSTMPNNLGHYAWLKAGLPVDVPGYTVQENANSGLQALRNAFWLIAAGEEETVLAGGADSYSSAPFVMRNVRLHFDPKDRMVIDSLDEAEFCTQPEALSRKVKYAFAHGEGESEEARAFREEDRRRAGTYRENAAGTVVPLSYTDRKKGEIVISEDEWLSAGSDEVLAPHADAAAAALLMSGETLEKKGLSPLAEILGFAACGGDPKIPERSGAAAAQKLLAACGVQGGVALAEIAENSAADVLETAAALGFGTEKINPFGGALSFGDGGGAEGFLMLQRLVSALKSGETGLLCLGSAGGMGMAALIRKC